MNYDRHLVGPDNVTQNLESQVHILRSRLTNLRSWMESQVGAFPSGPHSQGSDLMAARVLAEIENRFRGMI
jgi:hypothetical protein